MIWACFGFAPKGWSSWVSFMLIDWQAVAAFFGCLALAFVAGRMTKRGDRK